MIEICGEKVWSGDFHGQWNEGDETLPVLVAGLLYYGYDFTLFNGPGHTGPDCAFQRLARDLSLNLRVFPWGRECMFDWEHVIVGGMPDTKNLPAVDEADYKKTLAELKKRAGFVSLAHPYDAFIDKLDAVFDEGLADAFEIHSADISKPLVKWCQGRLAKGRPAPVVTGMDIHTSELCPKPSVLGNSDSPPKLDIDLLDRRRTLVFCESPEPDAVYSAVKAGLSVAETDGRLTGPPKLIEKLERGGYFKEKARALEAREKIKLKISGSKRVSSSEELAFEIQNARPGRTTVFFPSAKDGSALKTTPDKNGRTVIFEAPFLSSEDLYYCPVNVKFEDGSESFFAVKTRASFSLDINPFDSGGIPLAELSLTNNSFSKTLSGSFVVRNPDGAELRESFKDLPPLGTLRKNMSPGKLVRRDIPQKLTVSARDENGFSKSLEKNMVFVRAPHSDAGWDSADSIFLDRPELLDPMWTSGWRGPDDCSAELRILWDKDALRFRMRVTDDILCPTPRPNLPFMGDCVQLGVNPLDREDVPAFSFYDVIVTRAETPNRCVIRTAPKIALENLEPGGYELPERCLGFKRLSGTETLIDLDLPWDTLAPARPVKGLRIGLFAFLWDNDGDGLKAALAWPVMNPSRCWYRPSGADWAKIELV